MTGRREVGGCGCQTTDRGRETNPRKRTEKEGEDDPEPNFGEIRIKFSAKNIVWNEKEVAQAQSLVVIFHCHNR